MDKGHGSELIALGDLRAEVDRPERSRLRVVLSGRSASRDAGRTLAPLFDRVLAAAREERRALDLHFEGLVYFNSSTVAALVQFIRAANERGVALTIVYDARQHWQALSFDALRRTLRPLELAQGGAPLRFAAST